MYEIKVGIEGVAPMLMNKMTEEAQEILDKGATGGKMSREEREAEALQKAYRNGDGLYVPAEAIEACLIEGTRKAGLKFGKASLAPYLKATVFIHERQIALGRKEPDGIDIKIGRRPPRTGGRCLIRRPIINLPWNVHFTFVVTDDRRSSEQIKAGLMEAGLLCGLLDMRPTYGRFIVTEWEVKRDKV